jgi:prephenate dehydrogenase
MFGDVIHHRYDSQLYSMLKTGDLIIICVPNQQLLKVMQALDFLTKCFVV